MNDQFRARPPSLPPPLQFVRSPAYFNPSTFADLRSCPLSVIHGVQDTELLSPHPAALLGSIVHEVMYLLRGLSNERGEVQMTAEQMLMERVAEIDAELAGDRSTLRVPLRKAVGRATWRSRIELLREWASIAKSELPSPALRPAMPRRRSSARTQDESEAPTSHLTFGAERPLTVPALRLKGRPDDLGQAHDGTIHVTDLKTGRVLDDAGNPASPYALQLRLYALMVEYIQPGVSLRLWLEGHQRVEVAWNADYRAEVVEVLAKTSAELPSGEEIPAERIAHTGKQCFRCRVRHRCSIYLETAPEWWGSTSSTGLVAPLDVWGRVIRIDTREPGTIDVEIVDAVGRTVTISGLTSNGMEYLQVGDEVWFFQLEATEDLPCHGAFTHPHNFHERAPSRAWSDARRLSVFIGRK